MANIASISVGLFAKTAKFQKDMKKARRTTKGFGASVAAMGKKVAGVGTALAGLAAAAGIGYMTKQSFAAIDATAKLADRLGETTERLQGLRHAAEITGAGTEVMDKSLEKMQKTLGEAQQGIGQGRYALDALGVSVDQLMGKSPGEQFAFIADKVKELETAEERAFVATNLFGRSGQALVNTMMLGSDGLAQMQEEAEKLGIAFNRVDAAQVEAANDAITRLQSAFTGVFNQLAIKLAPFVTAFADKIVDLSLKGNDMGINIANGFEYVLTAIATAADYVELLKAAFYTLASGLGTVLQGVLKIFLFQWERLLTTIADGLEWVGADDTAKGLRDSLKTTNDLADAFGDKAKESADKAVAAYDKFSKGETQGKVKRFFSDIRAEARTAAEKVAEESEKAMQTFGGPKGFDVDAGVGSKGGKRPEVGDKFTQMNLHHIALSGTTGMARPKKVQEVESRQLAELVELQREANRKTGFAIAG